MPSESPLPPLTELAARIGETLCRRGETVAVSESSAGGLVSAALLAVPGASAYFLGGAVTYSRRAGKAFLAFTADDMVGLRSETEPYACLVATRVRDRLGATWGLCETGAAGPSGSPYGDAPGHVCVAVAGPVDGVAPVSRTHERNSTERAANMEAFARHLLVLFDEKLRASESAASGHAPSGPA